MGVDELVKAKREDILRLAVKHGAKSVRIFGSVARGEVQSNSDVDVVVRLTPEAREGGFAYFGRLARSDPTT